MFQEDAAPEHFLYGGDKSKEKSADRRQQTRNRPGHPDGLHSTEKYPVCATDPQDYAGSAKAGREDGLKERKDGIDLGKETEADHKGITG